MLIVYLLLQSYLSKKTFIFLLIFTQRFVLSEVKYFQDLNSNTLGLILGS